MTLTASNTSLVLVLLDANLRALGFVVHNLSLDGHLGQIGGGKGDLVTIDNEETGNSTVSPFLASRRFTRMTSPTSTFS